MRVLETDQLDAAFQPAALVQARMLRGLTQMDLALASGTSRQQINKLERGEVKSPTQGTVHEIARALSIPACYLAAAPGRLPPAESLHFRGKMRKPVRVVDQLRVRGEHFSRLVKLLKLWVRLGPVQIPERTATDSATIERAAEMCRVEWGLRVDNPIGHMTRVLERAGALVGLVRHDDDVVEAFSWWDGRPLVLCKRGGDSATRRRWSLAHELGHLVMHRHDAAGDYSKEQEAHRFAGAFLLPERAFRLEFPRRSRLDWDGLLEMKRRWGVSVQAILHRAHDLGVITGAMYRSAYVRISQLEWRRHEPEEPAFEQPELVPNIIKKLRETGLNVHNLAQRLGFDVEMLEDAVGVNMREPMTPGAMGKNVVDFLEKLHQRAR